MHQEVPRLPPTGLAVAGLVVSGALEWIHITTHQLPSVDSFCTVSAQLDCGAVTLSRFSVLLGIPLPIWGIAGFLAMAGAAIVRSKLLWPLAAAVSLASIGLLAEELLHIGAVCLLCEVVHGIAILLGVYAWHHHRRRGHPITRRSLLRITLPSIILLIATVVALPRYWEPLLWQQGVPLPHGVDDDGHPWVGAAQPTMTVEEFVDYGCPHCAVASNRMRLRLTDHPDRLRVVRRHVPRQQCKPRHHGCVALRAAHCAQSQDKFWEMDTWLFAHVPGQYDFDVRDGAQALGLDETSFILCLEQPDTYAWAAQQAKAARALKIGATPSYRIEGRTLAHGELHPLLDTKL